MHFHLSHFECLFILSYLFYKFLKRKVQEDNIAFSGVLCGVNKENIDPSNAIMIDDNKKNILGALSTNLNGIIYTDVKDLKEKLTYFLKK